MRSFGGRSWRVVWARQGLFGGLARGGWVRQAGVVVIAVTRVGGDGSVRRAVLDTAGRDDAGRWELLVERSGLGVPLPYRPEPGEPVYEVSAGGRLVQVAERDLAGPLRDLVTAVLALGGGSG